MTDPEVVYRPFRVGDEEAVNRGFNEVFRLERSMDEWSWKFPAEPDGRLIMLAERDGELLALLQQLGQHPGDRQRLRHE